ncbi:granulocyte-macrophage colony-stimulating factor receptor subunit alpha [Pteropus medius]|uniref:granulocyte-macrophage colony-stimulating factor receptor subunit alpha n=1 Tax=Pteropus vampyrus TaxID=132908 RepID=UPI00196AF72D|nr:granulocyte-macrophage colony-stimulating factor receptor subunit alpha [Pteropus giganteus]XP_039711135.1 granulocyte-macrophage colony-stimulating factor receptor subunit alpha [Pteropus giganteus]
MNCSWTKGPAAPDDVQYFLYVQDSKKQWGRECPHYVRESGTHVGCHMPDVSSWASQAYFLVNGTSRHAKIQFFDSFLWLKTIERCNPPGNISVLCNATHCRILWEKPRTRRRLSDRDFQYQLQVQQEDDVERARSQLIELPGDLGNKYYLLSPQPRAAHTLRIRAADTRVQQWSAWSQPVTFGSQESRGRFVYVYVLVVLGTVVCVLAVSCLIQRLCRGRRLFPPIPQIKDKLNDSPQPDQVLWETLAPAVGKEDVDDLLTMEEVAEPTAGTSDAATSASP